MNFETRKTEVKVKNKCQVTFYNFFSTFPFQILHNLLEREREREIIYILYWLIDILEN